MRPHDDLFRVYAGLDVEWDWVRAAETEFGITITEDASKLPDTSFDTLLHYVDLKVQEKCPSSFRGQIPERCQ
jgi:hypothetical protein